MFNMSGAYPKVVSCMIASVQFLDDSSVMPFATVAGTVADGVAGLLFEKKACVKLYLTTEGISPFV